MGFCATAGVLAIAMCRAHGAACSPTCLLAPSLPHHRLRPRPVLPPCRRCTR